MNVLRGGLGTDQLNGGAGIDTAAYGLGSATASFSKAASGVWTVNAGAEGVETMTGLEFVQFADRTLALRPAEGSIDGDGTSDIILRNANGTIALWTQSGATVTSTAVIGASDATYAAAGQGDFNGDGRYDILFRNANGRRGRGGRRRLQR